MVTKTAKTATRANGKTPKGAPIRDRIVDFRRVKASELLVNPKNWRTHPATQQSALRGVLAEIGYADALLARETPEGLMLIDGHLRRDTTPDQEVPVLIVDLDEAEADKLLLTLDPLAAMATADSDRLAALLALVQTESPAVAAMLEAMRAGYLTMPKKEARPSLADRFVVPPFSVLDARQGYWQERKRQWLAMGIQSELGRGDNVLGLSLVARQHYAEPGGSPHGATVTQAEDGTLAYRPTNNGDGTQSGTSVFDPVLCELAYRWFSPLGGLILDPFAGGSVRGIVASVLGRRYVGVDLSKRQLAANRVQAATITPEASPTWIAGDSINISDLASAEYDLIFSCPPYADLEVYSDDPADISTMPYADFLAAYREIIKASVAMLKRDRFACFVVGDIRDKKGYYRNFVSHTIEAFQAVGAILYNDAILVTAVGSLSIRVGRQFTVGRKLGKTHQNVLVFVKGDPKRAAEACGTIEVEVPVEESAFA